MLNFIKHHLSKCSADTKATASVIEYACVLWDLHYQTEVRINVRKSTKACS